MRYLLILPFLSLSCPALALGSAEQPSESDRGEARGLEDDILVIATRIRGQVDTSQPPIITLDEADIESYGASSIGELLEAVSPQTGSGRGRGGGGHPVILLNGQRISSFRVLRSIPPEAIRRMEVLPEEVALRFGFRPDRRVVNFILKDNFQSLQAAGEYNVPTRGGFAESELEAGLSRFDGPRRLNLNWKMEDASALSEAERGIIQPVGSIPTVVGDRDPAEFRSLVSDSIKHTVNGSWSTGLGEDGLNGTVTLDGLVSRQDSRSLSGFNTVPLVAPDGSDEIRSFGDPIVRDSRSDTLEAGLSLNKPVGGWQLTVTGDAVYSTDRTFSDRRAGDAEITALIDAAATGALAIDGPLPQFTPAGRDTARSKILTLSGYTSLAGTPLRLPAGEVSLTVDGGYDHLSSSNFDTRGTGSTVKLNRGIVTGGVNLGLPLTSRSGDVLGAIGDITLNLSGSIHHFSDFGSLMDWSAGLVWSPLDKLTLNASYIVSEVAPSLGQLGNPEILAQNVPIFDFTRGETALVSIISGGNPALRAEQQRDIKLSANYELPLFRNSSVLVEYFRNNSRDVTRSFPLLTPAIETAFADRVVRDGAGQLVSIDRRPVTYDRVESSSLRWGLNLSGQVAKQKESAGRQGRGGGGRPGFGRRGRHGGRWNISAYHTVRFTDRVTIAPGVPVFDQLDGFALNEGGVPRHAVELEGGVFHKGFGVRINGNWNAPAHVRSTTPTGNSDLRFGSVLRLDARFFINLGQREKLVAKAPWIKGLRIAFDFNNIFDSRQRVTDQSGFVPLAFQRGFRDPRGRFAGIDIRKRF